MENNIKIDIWYCQNQSFGKLGNPQKWINILGRVYSKTPIKMMTYRLNGQSPRKLSFGPDKRRLIGIGDFNIDIDIDELISEKNEIFIEVFDIQNQKGCKNIFFDFQKKSLSLPLTIEWQKETDIQKKAAIVDGIWVVDGNSISPY